MPKGPPFLNQDQLRRATEGKTPKSVTTETIRPAVGTVPGNTGPDVVAPWGKTYAETVEPYATALHMIRDAIQELFGVRASLESEEAVLLRGPEPIHDAEAIIAALQRVDHALEVVTNRAAGIEPVVVSQTERAGNLEIKTTIYEDAATVEETAEEVPPMIFGYTNHRGVFEVRHVTPIKVWYGSTKWHPEPQWFLKAWCHKHRAERDFAYVDMVPYLPDAPYIRRLIDEALRRMSKAVAKFPQPNYVLTKVAEEAGELVKAGVHYAEGRAEWHEVEAEAVDTLAMVFRLMVEGDGVIGLYPPRDEVYEKGDDEDAATYHKGL